MTDHTILITIDDAGISIEGQGFQGSGCVSEVSRIMRKLGVQGELEKKPEYYQNRGMNILQEIKQNSD